MQRIYPQYSLRGIMFVPPVEKGKTKRTNIIGDVYFRQSLV